MLAKPNPTSLCLILCASWIHAQPRTSEASTKSQYSNGVLEMRATSVAIQTPGVAQQRFLKYGSIAITFKNISPGTITLWNSVDVRCDYIIGLVDSAGVPARKTDFGLRLPETEEQSNSCWSISTIMQKLEVEEERTWTWDITPYFVLDPEQVYSVKLSRSRGLPKSDLAGKPVNSLLTVSLKIQPAVGGR